MGLLDPLWDTRDEELSIRDRMAHLIAEYVSGVEGAVPNERDYEITDKIARVVCMEY
jgi:hypothetical protein